MNKRTWSNEDRDEFDLVITLALGEDSVPGRRDRFLEGLDGAIQARRFWAQDVYRDIRDAGADRILKAEHQARQPRVPVSHDGVIMGRVPRVLGVRRRSESGAIENHRALFDYMTWEELRAKLPFYAQQIQAFERDAHAVIRLLALESLAPGAATPADACARLGTTVEDFLADERAS